MDIKENVLEALKSLGIKAVQLDDHLEQNLGMDSQEIVSLVTILEKKFDVEFTSNSIQKNMRVKDIVTFIHAQVSENCV